MKKILALTLVLLLALSLFAGCSNSQKPSGTAAPEPSSTAAPGGADTTAGTDAPVGTDAPAGTDAPVVTEPSATGEPASLSDNELASLLEEASKKMAALQSLGFDMDLVESVSSGEGESAFTLDISMKTKGTHTFSPNATYTKGTASMFGMEFPTEQYEFLEGKTLTSYNWDDTEACFLRSVSELEEEDSSGEEAPSMDYQNLDLSAVREGDEYLITVNAKIDELAVLFQMATGFLSNSEATETLPDFSELEEYKEMKDVVIPFLCRVNADTGYLTGCSLDMTELLSAAMAAAGEEGSAEIGAMSGTMELRYYDFDAVAPITPPENFKDYDEYDWGEDWDEDWTEEETEEAEND